MKKEISAIGLVAVFILCFFSFAIIGVASAADYYVAKTGNDDWEGNATHPWLTVNKSCYALTAGDTVYIKEGTYNERAIPQNNGTSENYITYTAYPGDTVTIDGTGLSTYPSGLFRIENKDYIKVSGLSLKNYINTGACFGIYIYNGSDHIIIENNIVNNTGGCGIYAHVNANNIIIDNNEVSYTNLDPAWGQEMISLCDVDTFEVKNNYVHHSDNIGIDAKSGCSNGKIYRNHVHNTSSGIYTDAYADYDHDTDIYENIVHDVTANCYQAATENGGTLENIRFFNNIGYNSSSRGFVIYNYPGIVNNITVINNAFHECAIYCMMCTEENATNITFRNNINSECPGIKSNALPEVIIDHNLFSGYSQDYGDDYIIANPEFVNVSEGDFHLQSDSPAIDNGSSVDAPSVDYDGNPRPIGAGYDIGAYEYLSGPVGLWHFDEGEGTTAVDSSGNGNNGTIIGANWTTGKIGSALNFDGIDDYVDCGNDTSLNITGAITVEAWVNMTSITANIQNYIVSKIGTGYWFLGYKTDTKYWRIILYDGTNYLQSSWYDTSPTNKWLHIVSVFDGVDTTQLYVNGIKKDEDSGTMGDYSAAATSLSISTAGNFNGIIDEVRIYNRALSAEEINESYQSSFTCGYETGDWSIDFPLICSDSTVNVDASGKLILSSTLTLINSTIYIDKIEFKPACKLVVDPDSKIIIRP